MSDGKTSIYSILLRMIDKLKNTKMKPQGKQVKTYKIYAFLLKTCNKHAGLTSYKVFNNIDLFRCV